MASNPSVETILVECALATGKRLGNKAVATKAAEYWAGLYAKSIADQLANNAVWKNDRRAVLVMAEKLGRRARVLAGSSNTVSLATAKKASKINSADNTCAVGPGGGRYCPLPA